MYVQHEQGGLVGIIVDCLMYEPLTDNDFDQEAANRALAFYIGWYCFFYYLHIDMLTFRNQINEIGLIFLLFLSLNRVLDPLVFGKYPSEMRRYLGNQLPRFSSGESNFMKDGVDFIGVNYYTTIYAKDCIHSNCSLIGNRAIKGFVDTTSERDSIPIGESVCMKSLFCPIFTTDFSLFTCVDRRQ